MNFLKKHYYCLIGGIIGIIFVFFVAILDFVVMCDLGKHMGEWCGLFLVMIVVFIPGAVSLLIWGNYLVMIINVSLFYFLIGAGLGYLIEKIVKNRKESFIKNNSWYRDCHTKV